MNKQQLQKIAAEYQELRTRRCVQTGNTNGAHYLLCYALMQAGVEVRGLDNSQLEGEAIRIIGLYGGGK